MLPAIQQDRWQPTLLTFCNPLAFARFAISFGVPFSAFVIFYVSVLGKVKWSSVVPRPSSLITVNRSLISDPAGAVVFHFLFKLDTIGYEVSKLDYERINYLLICCPPFFNGKWGYR